MKAVFAVDFDGTLIDDHHWPEFGDWLPGAVWGLQQLQKLGDVVIYSCRTSPFKQGAGAVLRPADERFADINGIYRMLEEAGLKDITVWTGEGKPAAAVYIDNLALRFNGDWAETIDMVLDVLAAGHGRVTESASPWMDMLKKVRHVPVDCDVPFCSCGANWVEDPPDLSEPQPEDFDPELDEGCDTNPITDWGFTVSDGPDEFFADLEKATRHPSSQRFHEILEELGTMHDEKSKGYGTDEDPFYNVRSSEEWGVDGWVGGMIRGTDKIRRLQAFARKGELPFEAVEDAFKDLAVYCIISLVLFEQSGLVTRRP